jgi:hypothetical protein
MRQEIKQELYTNGDKAVYTGKPAYSLYGGTWYDYKLVEGHKAGEIVTIPEHRAFGGF